MYLEKTMIILVGQKVKVGWNGAKLLGDETIAYEEAHIEGYGLDWIVLRDGAGYVHVVTFNFQGKKIADKTAYMMEKLTT